LVHIIVLTIVFMESKATLVIVFYASLIGCQILINQINRIGNKYSYFQYVIMYVIIQDDYPELRIRMSRDCTNSLDDLEVTPLCNLASS
jgi:hypothetical protein